MSGAGFEPDHTVAFASVTIPIGNNRSQHLNHSPTMTIEQVTLADGRVAIYMGDCREIIDSLPVGVATMIFTAPPYGYNNKLQ